MCVWTTEKKEENKTTVRDRRRRPGHSSSKIFMSPTQGGHIFYGTFTQKKREMTFSRLKPVWPGRTTEI